MAVGMDGMLYMHPEAYRSLADGFDCSPVDGMMPNGLCGVPIVQDSCVPAEGVVGYEPADNPDRFTEYDESDLSWQVPLGMAKPVTGPVAWCLPKMDFEVSLLPMDFTPPPDLDLMIERLSREIEGRVLSSPRSILSSGFA